jgi:hypothetical protein
MGTEWVDDMLRLQRESALEEWPVEEVEYRLCGKVIQPPGASPKSRRRYMRERLAAALPEIATSLLRGAKEGRMAELKVVMQMCESEDKKTTVKAKRFGGRSFEDILMEGWGKEQLDGAGTNGVRTNRLGAGDASGQDGRTAGLQDDGNAPQRDDACDARDGGGVPGGCGSSESASV